MKRRVLTAALVLGLASVSSTSAASSVFAAGWQLNAEQKWEYYDENEKLVKSQWIEEAGKYYYVDENGAMVRNTSAAKMGGQTPLRKCCEYCKNVSMDIVDDKCIIRFLTVNEERARKLRV